MRFLTEDVCVPRGMLLLLVFAAVINTVVQVMT